MAKDQKLKAALDRYKGVDHKLERQKKLQKQAEKRKKQKRKNKDQDDEELEIETFSDDEQPTRDAQALITAQLAREGFAAEAAGELDKVDGHGEGWETDESGDAEEDQNGGLELGALEDESESESELDEPVRNGNGRQNGDIEDDEEDAEDIPLSDIESLASDEKGDVIPHQRLTINNTAALERSLKSFALPSSLPFSAVQSVTSAEPVHIPDVEDDLSRELAFYKQSLDAVKEARALLKKEGVPFSRPADYFAEMVKSEEQMGKVKQKMVDEAARKKASADARRQRDLKKFGKAVQVAKLQERAKAKNDTLDKINILKRKRQGADLTTKEDDMFDVALEDAATTEKADRASKRERGAAGGPPNRKRQKKDEKFGFGGKKRFAKSNDAKSAGDGKGYSVKKMKGKGGKQQRPGKSKRAKAT
ncbi:rRNA-processing protein EBP2 [Vermiconidia calcicola]|uniref:rRNA-processing protein EBP2 n=1 Tax=Vermiconidia calcicola TaxID=1690605 RepID=A0ACC3MQN5_9PEZI|nr:rRNA-processing protein EBP2 [Vermiconidia calcicola]